MRLDWLQGTIKKADILAVVAELERLFVCCGWTLLDRGIMGYTCSAMFCESGRVLWNLERPEMGVHLILPSGALDAMGCTPEAVLSDLYRMGFVATRIDIAADDFEGRVLMPVVQEKVLAGEMVTRSKSAHEDRKLSGGAGHTIYFGQRTSASFLRIYDKSAEQAGKRKGVYTAWVRVELELKGKRAAAAARVIVRRRSGWHEMARGWILSFLDFKEPGVDSNKSRWETTEWWSLFLENASKLRLAIDVAKRSIEDARRWVDKQVVPSLYLLGQAMGYVKFFDMILTGEKRLSERHQEMLEEYRRVAGPDFVGSTA